MKSILSSQIVALRYFASKIGFSHGQSNLNYGKIVFRSKLKLELLYIFLEIHKTFCFLALLFGILHLLLIRLELFCYCCEIIFVVK